MSILYVDLERKRISTDKDRDEKGYLLLKALTEEKENCIAFSALGSDAIRFKGASSSVYAFYSPLRRKVHYGHTSSSFSFVLYTLGYSALVITGKSDVLCYISIRGNAIEIRECPDLKGSSYDFIRRKIKEKESDIVIATGPAADKNIEIAALYDEYGELGRAGFGFAFSRLNLKAIAFQSLIPRRRESEEGRKYKKAIEKSSFARTLKRESTTSWIKSAESCGFLAIENFTRRHDRRAVFLDGTLLQEEAGVYSISCNDCAVSCRRMLKDGTLAPDLAATLALGPMLGIFSYEKITELRNAVFSAGLESIEASAMLASAHPGYEECLERIRMYNGEKYDSYRIGGISPLFDIRGTGEAALFMILGDSEIPYYSLFAPMRIKSNRISAILALFERIYRYALSSRGLPVKGSYAAYISRIPKAAYLSAPLLRSCLEHITMFSLPAKTLIKEGLEIINELGEDENAIPDHFIYTSSSSVEDTTVKPARLLECYYKEKSRLESKYLDTL